MFNAPDFLYSGSPKRQLSNTKSVRSPKEDLKDCLNPGIRIFAKNIVLRKLLVSIGSLLNLKGRYLPTTGDKSLA